MGSRAINARECLLIGVNQTQCGHVATSESDPKRTFVAPLLGVDVRELFVGTRPPAARHLGDGAAPISLESLR
jgi:hypothetical protein